MGGLIIDEPEEINTGAKLYPKDILNHVLLVWAVGYIPHSPTQYNDGSDPKKPCDVVVVDVVDLDQLNEDNELGMVARQCWWRQGKLIQRLKPRVGKPNPLIGRMGKGLGANGAFELIDLSADEKALARAQAWWQKTGGITPSEPYQPVQAPVAVSHQSNPTPPPSPLENRVNETLDRLRGHHENNPTLDRLRQLADRNQSETPPF